LPLQSNSGHHPTPLFWYLGFHGNAILNFIGTKIMGWGDVRYCFAMAILVIIIIFPLLLGAILSDQILGD
jgi:hypothetical protein